MTFSIQNDVPFLVYTDRKVKQRSIIHITSKNEEEFLKDLDKILWSYNLAVFTISLIHVDSEFKPVMDKDKGDMDVTMNYANPVDHIPDI